MVIKNNNSLTAFVKESKYERYLLPPYKRPHQAAVPVRYRRLPSNLLSIIGTQLNINWESFTVSWDNVFEFYR